MSNMRERGHMAGPGPTQREALFGGTAARLPDGPVQRSALFGRSAGYAPAPVADQGARHALEEDNNRLTAELERKVSALKQATLSIHDEVSEHNRMLNVMGNDFDRTGNLMAGALQRVSGLLQGGGTQGHLCYLVLFVVTVFIILWRFVK